MTDSNRSTEGSAVAPLTAQAAEEVRQHLLRFVSSGGFIPMARDNINALADSVILLRSSSGASAEAAKPYGVGKCGCGLTEPCCEHCLPLSRRAPEPSETLTYDAFWQRVRETGFNPTPAELRALLERHAPEPSEQRALRALEDDATNMLHSAVDGQIARELVWKHRDRIRAFCAASPGEPGAKYDGEAHDLVCRVLSYLTDEGDPEEAVELLRAAKKTYERQYEQRRATEPYVKHPAIHGGEDLARSAHAIRSMPDAELVMMALRDAARRSPEPVAKPGEDFTLKQIAEFCGFLSAQIPELHNIHPDLLWAAFGKYLEASLPSAPTKGEKL